MREPIFSGKILQSQRSKLQVPVVTFPVS